jgi:hypothetical protein
MIPWATMTPVHDDPPLACPTPLARYRSTRLPTVPILHFWGGALHHHALRIRSDRLGSSRLVVMMLPALHARSITVVRAALKNTQSASFMPAATKRFRRTTRMMSFHATATFNCSTRKLARYGSIPELFNLAPPSTASWKRVSRSYPSSEQLKRGIPLNSMSDCNRFWPPT